MNRTRAVIHRLECNVAQDDTAVLFVDMLGFADMTEAHDFSLDFGNVVEQLQSHTSEMSQQFRTFHECLASDSWNRNVTTAVVFSDSGFFAFDSPIKALRGALLLMRSLVGARVACRMGLGSGSFRALSFGTTTSRGSTRIQHSSQFLGTAVVRAYRAESSGLSGLRILIHDSAAEAITNDLPAMVIPVIGRAANDAVHWEGNYLYERPRRTDDPESEKPVPMFGIHFDASDFEPTAVPHPLVASVTKMMSQAPAHAVRHYEETLRSFELMKLSLHMPPGRPT